MATARENMTSIGHIPRLLCAVSVLLSVFVQANGAPAAPVNETTQYATSFFSLTDSERVKQVNRELSKILQTYPTIKVFHVTRIPVTAKGKKYFRSVIVTDQEGLHELKEREDRIGSLLARKALRLYGLTIHVRRWAYRIEKPIPMRKPKTIPLAFLGQL